MRRLYWNVLLVVGSAFALCAQPQSFKSGSTGSDGALTITAPGITYFAPKSSGLDPSGDNVFNFTNITIAAGSTLKLTEEVLHGPVYFLSQGDVVIAGNLDLSGDNGAVGSSQSDRAVTYAGSGGYGGGLGSGPGGAPAPLSGNGPGRGTAGTATSVAGLGQFTGNQYLIPLIGGSGGGGAYCTSSAQTGGSGGAGGGAILIASSTTITVSGAILANGGNWVYGSCTNSGAGSGGAIRLMSNTINGGGQILAEAGYYGSTRPPANSGRVRLEAFQQGFTGQVSSPNALSTPYNIAVPATPPASLTVTSINGVPINANPFSFPDAFINTSSPVTINVQAQYIPTGTVPTIYTFSETGPDQIILCAAPLAGTLASSTCTASIAFVTGGSRGFVKATW